MPGAPFPLPEWSPRWDPRPEAEACRSPIPGVRNIPLEKLEDRQAELPPKGVEVLVLAEGLLVEASLQALAKLDRSGRVESPEPSRHMEGTAPTRMWRPNPFLETLLSEGVLSAESTVSEPRAIDLACGSGREALLLASFGWQVTAVDRLEDVLAIGRGLEAAYADPGAPRVSWLQEDLEAVEAELGSGFQLAVCFRYLNRRLLAEIHQRLAPGGVLVFETFTELHRATFGRPRRDTLVLRTGEAPTLISGMEVERFQEGWHEGAHTARLLARKC